MSCECRDVAIGSYDNQVEVERPLHMQLISGKKVCIDKCLIKEIEGLWKRGITTTGCCCGHNKIPNVSFIGVAFEDIPAMKKLGYEVHFNACRPDDEDSFKPKSLRL